MDSEATRLVGEALFKEYEHMREIGAALPKGSVEEFKKAGIRRLGDVSDLSSWEMRQADWESLYDYWRDRD
ncbi:hypothetical protein [Streptomyces chrestomyceticus]|uniref:Uncharacterized protein n=1 Tax=Streptomyces chrestomyceticus TaxID=68185 RepID=A0ABU7WLK8_9ACTN